MNLTGPRPCCSVSVGNGLDLDEVSERWAAAFENGKLQRSGYLMNLPGSFVSNARLASETGPVRCQAATAALEKVTMFGDRGS